MIYSEETIDPKGTEKGKLVSIGAIGHLITNAKRLEVLAGGIVNENWCL